MVTWEMLKANQALMMIVDVALSLKQNAADSIPYYSANECGL